MKVISQSHACNRCHPNRYSSCYTVSSGSRRTRRLSDDLRQRAKRAARWRILCQYACKEWSDG